MVEPNKRHYLGTGPVMVGLLVAGVFMLHAAAKAAQRENRIVERIRPVCAHNRFTNEEMHRLVRFTYGAWRTKEEAVQAVVALCRGNG
ncbi:hypothetical protein SAMN05444161_4674 [Rhizobiales bacterium GAS191]|nr:hypothetical protein SAMN05444161_4674 [Rhizobiales bacterium GAS191]